MRSTYQDVRWIFGLVPPKKQQLPLVVASTPGQWGDWMTGWISSNSSMCSRCLSQQHVCSVL